MIVIERYATYNDVQRRVLLAAARVSKESREPELAIRSRKRRSTNRVESQIS